MTCRTLEDFYHIDGHTFEKQYKERLSGYRDWEQLDHAEEWLLFPENIGPRLAIDESWVSRKSMGISKQFCNSEQEEFFVSNTP